MVCWKKGEARMKLGWKIWLLIILLFFSLLAIFGMPPKLFQKGVLITSVEQNSTAFEEGLRKGQIITEIDGKKINNLEDFSNALHGKFPSGENIKTLIKTDKIEVFFLSKEAPEITVSEIPSTNIKTGLDLSGGSRALIQAKDQKLSSNEINDLTAIINNRFNVYGISDMKVRPVSDLSGNYFLLIEIAGATPKDLENLISNQGKFEAKIGNETAFIGGEKDITSVCRNDATCAGIESCQPTGSGGYFCNFRFVVYLSEEAAQRHADITDKIEVNSTNPQYLSKPLDLYLDNSLVDSLFIGVDLKGRVTTQIQISGSGTGATKEDAYNSAKENMNKLQTILITGSLPYKLEIVKLDTISPVLGKDFTRAILLAGVISLLAVSIVIFIRYRKIKDSLALLVTCISEVVIILGIASLIKWDLDLPSIAGILVTIGTGIDQQIIVFDESKQNVFLSISQKMKRAFAVILGSYFTILVSLIPLYWAGAGLLKGFAVTTIIGITVGILITRPAFTEMVKKIEE